MIKSFGMNSSGKCELKVKKLTVNKRDTKKQWDLAMAKDGWIRDPEVSGHKQASHVGKCVSCASMCAQSLHLCLPLCDPMDYTRLFCPWDSPGKNTGVGCHALFRGSS